MGTRETAPTLDETLWRVVREMERRVTAEGWDQPLVFWIVAADNGAAAAVPIPFVTEAALEMNPAWLALGVLTTMEPPPFHADIIGVMVAYEAWMLDIDPTSPVEMAESELATANRSIYQHPARQEARQVIAYGRDQLHRTITRLRLTDELMEHGPDDYPAEGNVLAALAHVGDHLMQLGV